MTLAHLSIAHSIPGPIEVADQVLFANAHPLVSHVSLEFVPVFGDCIRMIRYASSPSEYHSSPILIQRDPIHKRRPTFPYQWERNSRLGPSSSISPSSFSLPIISIHYRYLRTSSNQATTHSSFTPGTLEIALLIGVYKFLTVDGFLFSIVILQVSILMVQP